MSEADATNRGPSEADMDLFLRMEELAMRLETTALIRSQPPLERQRFVAALMPADPKLRGHAQERMLAIFTERVFAELRKQEPERSALYRLQLWLAKLDREELARVPLEHDVPQTRLNRAVIRWTRWRARRTLPAAWSGALEAMETGRREFAELQREDRRLARVFVERNAAEFKPTEAEAEDLARRLFDSVLSGQGPGEEEVEQASATNPLLLAARDSYRAWSARVDELVQLHGDGPETQKEAQRQQELTAAVAFSFHWPAIVEAWRSERPAPLPAHLYRFPLHAKEIHNVLGAKRIGRAHGIPAHGDEEGERGAVRLTVTSPKGAQLELGTRGKVIAKPSDRDEDGKLRADAVMRMIAEHTGPQVAVMGHVAFALAELHARAEGRAADGRLWVSPTEIGDLLGYPRESNGKTKDGKLRAQRIGKEATATIRRNFETYANTVIEQTFKLPDGSEHVVRGPLLYPTQKEHTARKKGQRGGRDRRTEWRIRDELWALVARNYVLMPVELLNSQDEAPRVWAECIRLYEVLACHARRNTANAAVGGLPASFEWLVSEVNVSGPKVRDDKARQRVVELLKKLEARGALTFKAATLADGRSGVVFQLPEARRLELGTVAARASLHRKLQAQNPTKKRRKQARE